MPKITYGVKVVCPKVYSWSEVRISMLKDNTVNMDYNMFFHRPLSYI